MSKYQKGDVTFDVRYCPASDAEKLLAEDPEAWPGDYFRIRTFVDFKVAAEFACKAAASDFFGCASIHREVCENPRYDWWENTGSWYVDSDTKPGDLHEADPHEGAGS